MSFLHANLQAAAGDSKPAQAKPDYTGASPTKQTQAPASKMTAITTQPASKVTMSSSNRTVLSLWGGIFALGAVLLFWFLHWAFHITRVRPRSENKGMFKSERRAHYHFISYVWVAVQLVVFILVTLLIRNWAPVRRILPAGRGFDNWELILPGLLIGFGVGCFIGLGTCWGKHIRNKLISGD